MNDSKGNLGNHISTELLEELFKDGVISIIEDGKLVGLTYEQ